MEINGFEGALTSRKSAGWHVPGIKAWHPTLERTGQCAVAANGTTSLGFSFEANDMGFLDGSCL